ncbi:lipoprotein [Halalkalibacter wakoensis JCM 9140]|uniref:Lipoprotein n=1 Tax=Halalkalibacter wakoensis JCM 9140 TaxID=1236970 RepID=W4PYQ2_9BACI|nr:hypothetical protein [Halalkalibacter wakoensis]GAE24820.1 lipoprotein [Halalkalibacter wakoensis JCM 9140]
MTNFVKVLIYTTLLVGLAGCNIVTYENEEVFTLDADGLKEMVIHHEEGDVSIVGVPDLEQIEVTATFSAMSDENMEQAKQFTENNITLSLELDGTAGLLQTSVNRGTNVEQGFVHLEIEVPDHLSMIYRQNEGQLKIQSMKSDINVQHGANHLSLLDIEGNVVITDGAGNVTLENVNGDISINNNAGLTSVLTSAGPLQLVVGSGNVELQDHRGNVTIRSGSGNLLIQDIEGDVDILESRGGTVTIEEVTGTVTKP